MNPPRNAHRYVRSAIFSSLISSIVPFAASLKADDKPKVSIDFNRDIRPILSDNCFSCHGQTPKNRKAGTCGSTPGGRAGAAGSGGVAIVPGDSGEKRTVAAHHHDEKDE